MSIVMKVGVDIKQLMTQWGATLDKNNVLQDYPRPQLVRDSYLNLNGNWDFALSKDASVTEYPQNILVPFSPETVLSGIQQSVRPEDYMHYRKFFNISIESAHMRTILHFEAVDQECIIYINGHYVGEHLGGYLSFEFDITPWIHIGNNELKVIAKDFTEYQPHARGKQKLDNKGPMSSIFYPPTSGIWQTVWLEHVPQQYVKQVKFQPNYDQGNVDLELFTNSPLSENAQIEVYSQGQKILETQAQTNRRETLTLDNFIPWTPDQPHLYDVVIRYKDDTLSSYFALRKISVTRDQGQILRYSLNNEPIFINGVLDQGYWPDGGLTAPTDEALIYDIQAMQILGFNCLRKHVKIESARFYYHCDRLGMLVMQDMPNGGSPNYHMWFVTYLANTGLLNGRIKDNKYSLFGRNNARGRAQYYTELRGMINHLSHFPSIVAWVPFNEGWGQFDANQATQLIRQLDPSRLIIETSGWYDQGGGDTYTIHNYLFRLKVKPQNRVVALTEFGGYALPIEDHTATDHNFGYQKYNSMTSLTQNYQRLWREEIIPNIANGLSAAIYTQLSDVEEEVNGILTYDRLVTKLEASVVRELNKVADDFFAKLTKNNT